MFSEKFLDFVDKVFCDNWLMRKLYRWSVGKESEIRPERFLFAFTTLYIILIILDLIYT